MIAANQLLHVRALLFRHQESHNYNMTLYFGLPADVLDARNVK